MKHGAAFGSTIAMTPNAYLTDDAWNEVAPSICAGIHSMPVIKDNPDWWVLEVVDGYGSHVNNLDVLQI